MSKIKLSFIIIYAAFFVLSCGGLEPTETPVEQKTFIRGTVYFSGTKPHLDSLLELRVVAFRNYPPSDIIGEVLGGTAYFTPDSISRFSDTVEYEIEIPDAPQELQYIAVAQRYGSYFEWLAVGVYTTTGNHDEPAAVFAEKGNSLENININVNYDSLPPQPFE